MKTKNKRSKNFSIDEYSTKHSENLLFPELFLLDPVQGKRVEVSFTAPDLSSHGGLLLLDGLDHRLGFIDRLTGCLEDNRCPWLIDHTYEEMLLQRVFHVACGYEDADDCDLLRGDSVLKMCVGKSPDSSPLSSQPTMTRLENDRFIRELYEMGGCFVEEFISSYDEEPECIILDCDDTSFNAYGEHPNSRFIYESLYCGRGTMELYIKEMKVYLSTDRCSCNKFSANPFRFFVHAAAYVLLDALKETILKGTCLYNASILTLQQKILSGAVHVRTLKTKVRIEFSDKHPYRNELSLAFQRFSLWSGAA